MRAECYKQTHGRYISCLPLALPLCRSFFLYVTSAHYYYIHVCKKESEQKQQQRIDRGARSIPFFFVSSL